MSKLSFSKLLIVATVILVSGFQCYWIHKLYKQERETLRKETDVLFRDVVYKLQLQQFQSDTAFVKHASADNLFAFDVMNAVKENAVDPDFLKKTIIGDSDSKQIKIMLRTQTVHDDIIDDTNAGLANLPNSPGHSPVVFQYSIGNRKVNDSLSLQQIDSAYKSELSRNNINLPYTLKYISGKVANAKLPTTTPDELKTNFIFIGLSRSYAYQASFANPFNYLLVKIKLPILISLFLIVFTIISFVFLYRNLLAQKRLSSIKNEFISNITHELKTPIATVNVAIEALRNFNAIQDPVKTKEYLDISASELQRLSLLVDKVLRLSMFENGEVELKKEEFDLKLLVKEVIAIMQLQVEKQNALVTLSSDGDDFTIEADRMHITSVLYNLLDNALKYKKADPRIEISLKSHRMHIELKVKDNGIGIPAAYRQRVFEKLFRVPTDDVHNTKGYGLGLSYVSHIIRRHMGFIDVESVHGEGSVFTAMIPYKEMDVIWFDEKRSIRKKLTGSPKTNKI